MTGRTVYVVVGHLTATDATPDPAVQGKLDDGVDAVVCQTDQEIERALLWYQDGVVKAINV